VAGAQRFVVRQGDAMRPVEILADGRVRVGEPGGGSIARSRGLVQPPHAGDEGDPGDVFVVRAVSPGEYVVASGVRTWRVAVAGPPEARWVGSEGLTACLDVQPEGQARGPRARAVHGGLAAPMPGTVIDVAVGVGQQVRAGDLLLTLEAMKMELPIRAPRDGVVSAIRCAPGELVQPGPPLVEIT
jgi:biotin carboxyl carrier protein